MIQLPTIAVLGATGAQGGSVVRALLARGHFAVRALTRRPHSPDAERLRAAGASVVAADLDDAASLRAAFEDAHGLFAVTPFWQHADPDRELMQVRHIADAARDAGLAHVLWSTLEDTRRWVPLDDPQMPSIGGRWKVPHFDAKGAGNLLFRERGVPTTLLHLSFFWDNLVRAGMQPRRGAHGRLVLALPTGDRLLPGMAAADVGPCAAALFERGRAVVGRHFGIAGQHLSGAQMAHQLSRALLEPVLHTSPSFEAYAAQGFGGAPALANMFQFVHDFNGDVRARRPVAESRALHPGLLDFGGWLARHAHAMPIAAPALLA